MPLASPLESVGRSWVRSLRARNLAQRTLDVYAGAVEQLDAYLLEMGASRDPVDIKRSDIEGFINRLLATRTPATAANRYRSLSLFFKWLVEEDELSASPMDKMKPPR